MVLSKLGVSRMPAMMPFDQRVVDVGEVGPAADHPDGVDRAGVHAGRSCVRPLTFSGVGLPLYSVNTAGLAAQQAEVVEGLDAGAAAGGQHDDVAVELVEHPPALPRVSRRSFSSASRSRSVGIRPELSRSGRFSSLLPEHGVVVDLHLGVDGDPLALGACGPAD